MRFAITGTDERFARLRELLLADGHIPSPPGEADAVIPPPWDEGADYARSEVYKIRNAALTAEAAEKLLGNEGGVDGKKILILGYGRIGRLTAERLSRAGAEVSLAVRSREARAWVAAEGYGALDTGSLGDKLGEFDILVNTVPAPLLGREELSRTSEDVLLLELASSPGGIDAAAAHELNRRYLRGNGLPARFFPDRAAVIVRDALYETLARKKPRLGAALTGSHCSHARALAGIEAVRGQYELVPILSEASGGTDTVFGCAAQLRARLREISGTDITETVADAEKFGAREPLDILLIAPCTGNTLAKLACGVTDGAVTMAAKAHLRNGRPLVLAVSTNDGLSGSAENIGKLLQRKNVYFVPFRQDAPVGKPFSLQADFSLIPETLAAAREGRQLQPVLLGANG